MDSPYVRQHCNLTVDKKIVFSKHRITPGFATAKISQNFDQKTFVCGRRLERHSNLCGNERSFRIV